jgi:putative tryptophan/tyrosine transport system substrate-binding protein
MREVWEEIQMRLSTMGLVVPLALSLLVAPLCSDALQARKVARIGLLHPSSPGPSPLLDAFRQRLRELGWVEGQNLAIEYRWAEGQLERLPDLAADLVGRKVDVIVAITGTTARAAQKATSTIPIVFTGSGDAIAQGLVPSLARPEGNVTGVTYLSTELSGKQLELLKEAMPGLSRVAVLCGPTVSWPSDPVKDLSSDLQLREIETAAHALGLHLHSLEVRGLDDLEGAFAAATRDHAEALVVLDCAPLNVRHVYRRVIDLAAMHRLPAMYPLRNRVETGGLMAYGPNLREWFLRAAVLVDKILRGAKPADLPVEQPMRFELVLNRKTAETLGLTFPPTLLLRADEVLQ